MLGGGHERGRPDVGKQARPWVSVGTDLQQLDQPVRLLDPSIDVRAAGKEGLRNGRLIQVRRDMERREAGARVVRIGPTLQEKQRQRLVPPASAAVGVGQVVHGCERVRMARAELGLPEIESSLMPVVALRDPASSSVV